MTEFTSWGGYPKVKQTGIYLPNRRASFPNNEFPNNEFPQTNSSILPYGLGRSYGDSCLNSSGQIISSKLLKNFIAFDKLTGLLRCEAGVTLAEIIEYCLPHGWFLPVTPGTKYVTLGGALANDVHGKNHHLAGSFGNHVTCFELLRSDGSRLQCSPTENIEWFNATIGGLGLTGFVTWVELNLKKVSSKSFAVETIKYRHLNDFFTISEDSEAGFEYTAAWLDCLAKGKNLGRGHFIRGNHSTRRDINFNHTLQKPKKLLVPFTPPISFINTLTVSAFNQLYYQRILRKKTSGLVDYDPFLYPLDGILSWNRIYGVKGFVQHQCVIPLENAQAGIKEILEKISDSGLGSFLVVLKMMGNIASKGLISFSQEGATLAIDFPFQGEKTLTLLSQIDEVVKQAKGKVYPAKDARMSAELFQQAYPHWQTLESMRDPNINSDFWQRVSAINNSGTINTGIKQ